METSFIIFNDQVLFVKFSYESFVEQIFITFVFCVLIVMICVISLWGEALFSNKICCHYDVEKTF